MPSKNILLFLLISGLLFAVLGNLIDINLDRAIGHLSINFTWINVVVIKN